MNKVNSIVWLIFILINMVVCASAFTKDEIMGDPSDSLADILPETKWVTGSILGFFLISCVIGIIVGAIFYNLGGAFGNSQAKGTGISGIVGTVAVMILVTISLTLIFTVATKFL